MGAIASEAGITLVPLKPDGKTPSSKLPKKLYKSCLLTAQPATPGIGSQDWLKEIYLANNAGELYALLKTFPATGTHPPLTSLASQQVLVNYVDTDGTMRSARFLSCVASGKVNKDVPGKPTVVDTIQITQGDAHGDEENTLYDAFHAGALSVLLK